MLFSLLAAIVGPALIPFAVIEPHGAFEAVLVSLAGVLGTIGAIGGIVAPRWRRFAVAAGALLGALTFVAANPFIAGVQGASTILFFAAGLQPGARLVDARQHA
jgi:cytosine/uracil/thiamine/allantoin permease